MMAKAFVRPPYSIKKALSSCDSAFSAAYWPLRRLSVS